jgi:hypothetical protein
MRPAAVLRSGIFKTVFCERSQSAVVNNALSVNLMRNYWITVISFAAISACSLKVSQRFIFPARTSVHLPEHTHITCQGGERSRYWLCEGRTLYDQRNPKMLSHSLFSRQIITGRI